MLFFGNKSFQHQKIMEIRHSPIRHAHKSVSGRAEGRGKGPRNVFQSGCVGTLRHPLCRRQKQTGKASFFFNKLP